MTNLFWSVAFLSLSSAACQASKALPDDQKPAAKLTEQAGRQKTATATKPAKTTSSEPQLEVTNPAGTHGCDNTKLIRAKADLAHRGPWPVGARTINIAGLSTEMWYPAAPGSEVGKPKHVYELRSLLPESKVKHLPEANAPTLPCDCYRDLPIDASHGPYPVIVFVHGYTLFRLEAVSLNAHWASRGFVVLASDYPGITFEDVLEDRKRSQADLYRSVSEMISAAKKPAPGDDLEPFMARLDLARMGLVGHSMGGRAVGQLGDQPGVQVIISMAEAGIEPKERQFSSLIMGGTADRVEEYWKQRRGFDTSPNPKRLIGIRSAGHMAFSDLCTVNAREGGFFRFILDQGIQMKGFLRRMSLSGCKKEALSWQRGLEIVRYVTTAVLEESLHCSMLTDDVLVEVQKKYPEVSEYRKVSH